MNLSKHLVSTTAFITVIGAIGFAYAQTSPYNAGGTTTNPQTQNQGMTPGQSTPGTSTTPSTPNMRNQPPSSSSGRMNNNAPGMSNTTPTAAGTTTDSASPMGAERMARADRN